jgi:hypothetical protein
MGTLIAAVIIISLIFYALKDLLGNKDFSVWTSIALTSLILFSVILTLFLALEKKPSDKAVATGNIASATEEIAKPTEEQRQQLKIIIAKEYVEIIEEYKNANPLWDDAEAESEGAEFMMRKYGLSSENWNELLGEIVNEGWVEWAREQLEEAKEKAE